MSHESETDETGFPELNEFRELSRSLQHTLNRIADRRTARLIHFVMTLAVGFGGMIVGIAGTLALHHSEAIQVMRENRAAIETLRAVLEKPRYDPAAGVGATDADTRNSGRSEETRGRGN